MRPGFWHNVVAHPLLVLCPPVGEWLHAHTREAVPVRRGWLGPLTEGDDPLLADGWVVEPTDGGPS